ncbi:MAG: hypothetical protein ACYC6C_13530 [Coriobacteriia bacterium]
MNNPISVDSIKRAVWESRVGECNDAEWSTVKRRLPVDVEAAAEAVANLLIANRDTP